VGEAACRLPLREKGKTKMDELIEAGKVRAKKEGGRNGAVDIDLDSIDEYYDSLPDAGLRPELAATT
jgi:hypothetical protein